LGGVFGVKNWIYTRYMKTPLQELIDHMEYFSPHSPTMRDAVKKAKELLKKEQSAIIDAYTDGCSDGIALMRGKEELFKGGVDYYAKTFGE